ncbi:alpha-amylase family protein [Pseudoduganella namucuonensis]|uniref:Maltopentaose-forming-amylase n=1 Tax=Pseudoduganella namucuonensis TaxID=1035707 RepID=A0A1I7LAA0_9BURK|nr:alpha-amylase family protein [Pseudoduganella namucuonensis]SFV06639.1 maltopentaose-forming-amylase [Pseudoduganella namucuonensis]
MTATPLSLLLAALPESSPASLRADAARRYAAQERTLHARLEGLYGDRPGYAQWYAGLMGTVGALLAARPPELLALDSRREARPDWFLGERMLGYCAYVDRFGGSLRGVAERIPHLRELGVSYLHLLPFLRPREGENDGGFAVASFDDVDPRLGSVADLEALTARLRAAGISLCSDFILNHVADDHAWAQGARRGDPALRDYFHVFPDRDMPDRHERTLGQVFPQVAPGNFSHVEEMGGWVWTTFYPYQWDLNYANPAVFAEMAAALLRLANRGIEVFRLDSTAFLWKREGTNSMNQPEAHALLQALRAIVAIAAPGVLLKAEAIVPTRELPAYFGSEQAPECHIAYHSSLMAAGWGAVAEQDASLLRAVAAGTPPLPPAAGWLSYVRCHDDIGWNVLRAEAGRDAPARLARIARFYSGAEGSFASGAAFQSSDPNAAHGSNGMAASLLGLETAATDAERDAALDRVLLLHGLALAFGALPVLYMGDELAQQNDYGYRGRPEHAMDSRWLQRPWFDEAALARRHDGSTPSGRMYMGLRALIDARRRLPALAAGEPRAVLPSAPAVLALARGERFLCLCNFSALAQVHALDGTWKASLTGQAFSGEVALAPWALLWLERAA